jgi:hypothetical protein
MLSQYFNLPDGCGLADIDGEDNPTCRNCGAECWPDDVLVESIDGVEYCSSCPFVELLEAGLVSVEDDNDG